MQKLLLLLQLWAVIPAVGEKDCEGRRVGLRKTQVTVPLDDLLHIGPYTLYVGRRRVVIEIDDFTWRKRHRFSCQIAGSGSDGGGDKILLWPTGAKKALSGGGGRRRMAAPAGGVNRGGRGWLWV